jgi:hypothetical protein
MRETNQRGVDIVLNSLSGELLHTSWECRERDEMVGLGKKGFVGRGQLDMDLFDRGLVGVDITRFSHDLINM